jgi:hypothetical protein
LQEGLLGLYRVFIEDQIDFAQGAETFYPAYKEIRQYVMPMNPPRAALEQSLRLLYKEHDVKITKLYYFDRPRGKPEPGEAAEAIPTAGKRKKRRTRRKKKAAGESIASSGI